jgi:chemotaxis protein methyltransferase CheR
MTLLEAGLGPPDWDVRILASDIDTEVLARARAGIYAADRTEPIPEALRRRWFLRSRRDVGVLRVRPALQALMTWKQINFVDETWPVRGPLDMILCRNALIYFDRAGQRAILTRFHRLLKPEGVLILGHSESVLGLAEGFVNLGETIYRRAPGAPE